MDKKILFLTLLYILLLLMMFIYIALLLAQGTGTNKVSSWSFFGFAVIISSLCIVAVIKNESKSPLVKVGMGVATIIMFISLILSLVFAQPNSDKLNQIITYTNMSVVFLINMYAAFMLLGKPVIQPIFDKTQFSTE